MRSCVEVKGSACRRDHRRGARCAVGRALDRQRRRLALPLIGTARQLPSPVSRLPVIGAQYSNVAADVQGAKRNDEIRIQLPVDRAIGEKHIAAGHEGQPSCQRHTKMCADTSPVDQEVVPSAHPQRAGGGAHGTDGKLPASARRRTRSALRKYRSHRLLLVRNAGVRWTPRHPVTQETPR